MARVWVVGSLNVDRPWRVAGHPAVGETVLGDVGTPAAGGKGLNQAVAARRAGADVVLVGCVGDDADGRWLVEVAAAEGIDVAHVQVSTDRPTGSALIVVDDDGANTVIVAPGANQRLVARRLALASDDVVVAQLEVPEDVVADAFGQAAAVGATTVFNPSPVSRGRELANDASVVVLNELEVAELAPGDVPATAAEASDLAAAVARRDQSVVVTRGGAGAVLVSPDGTKVLPAPSVTPVDTTGAGDCFAGVLAAALAEGLALADAAKRATRAAALSVTVEGTVDAMPTAAAVAGAFGPTSS